MSRPDDRAADPFGRLAGTLVAASFGAVFVGANTASVPSPWSTVLRVLAVAAAVALALAAVLRFRAAARSGPQGRRVPLGRGYWAVVVGEVVALAAGLVVINVVWGLTQYAVAWVALVVGVHFVVLARVWRFTMFLVLGVIMSVLAVVGAVAGLLSGSALPVDLLAGVGSGVMLLAFGAWGVAGGSSEQGATGASA